MSNPFEPEVEQLSIYNMIFRLWLITYEDKKVDLVPIGSDLNTNVEHKISEIKLKLYRDYTHYICLNFVLSESKVELYSEFGLSVLKFCSFSPVFVESQRL